MLALVALDAQRITIYDGKGMILQSRFDGLDRLRDAGRHLQRRAEEGPQHNSNLYEDGNMPFMQRITWTGIALHAGVLPGHPASHGCVRLPIAFAQRLFELTDIGMRVVIARKRRAADRILPSRSCSRRSPMQVEGGTAHGWCSGTPEQHQRS